MNFIDWFLNCIEPGQKYGRLTVLSTHKIKGTYKYYAKCQCDCGSEPIYVRIDQLRGNPKPPRTKTESCGCLHKERVTKHGAWGHPLFSVWSGIMSRCYKPNDKRYRIYGKRGITVCDRWHHVNNFITDMTEGYQKELQINRIDNDRGYYKENCHWATRVEQSHNKSDTVLVTFNSITRSIRQWALVLHINYGTLIERIRILNWPIEKALTQPVRKGNYKGTIKKT